MDYKLDILKSFEDAGNRPRPNTWRKVWVTTVIVVPVLFACFTVYKFCSYHVIEDIDMHSLQSLKDVIPREEVVANISEQSDQTNHTNETREEKHEQQIQQVQPAQDSSVQGQTKELATLEFKPKPMSDDAIETMKNLNVLIKDLTEHNKQLNEEKRLLNEKIEQIKSNTKIYQGMISELKVQNDAFRVEVEEVRGVRSVLESDRDKYRRHRNLLATQLNHMMRTYAQFNCDILDWKQKAGHEVWLWVAETGGYCLKDKPPHYWDKELSGTLSKFLANKTVASFGEGPAYYQMEVMKLGEVTNYTSYDSSPFYTLDGSGESEEGKVKFLDISVPQYNLPQFDWVVCIEVGQHIPRKFERAVVENLCRHAKEGVVLSWSQHGQGGYSQPNPRSQGYLIELFDEQDFKLNHEESKHLRDGSTAGWLKRNLQVFRRKDPDSYDPDSS